MDKQEQFLYEVFDDFFDRYRKIFSDLGGKYPFVSDEMFSMMMLKDPMNRNPYYFIPSPDVLRIKTVVDEQEIDSIVKLLKKKKGSTVISDDLEMQMDSNKNLKTKTGSLVFKLPYRVRKKQKEAYFIFIFEEDLGRGPTMTILAPKDARDFVVKEILDEPMQQYGNVPRISVIKKYNRNDVLQKLLPMFRKKEIVHFSGGYGAEDQSVRPIALGDDETCIPDFGRLVVQIDYKNDKGKKSHGKFSFQIDYGYNRTDLTLVGPEDSSKHIGEFLEKLQEQLKEKVMIHSEILKGVTLGSLKKNLKGYKVQFTQVDNLTSLDMEDGKLVIREGTFDLIRKDKRRISVRADRRYQGSATEIEITGDEDLIEEMRSIIKKLQGEAAKVSTFSGEEVKLEGYTKETIAGMDVAFEELSDIIMYLEKPGVFEQLGITQEKGILLAGPPGTGKTLFAKVIASVSKASFLYIRASDVTSMWYGQEQKNIHRMFENAREKAPCIVFIDEIDSITPDRNRTEEYTVRSINQFLVELDGLKELKGVVIMAATNRKQAVDGALLRGGRIGRVIDIPLPDADTRKKIFEIHTKKMNKAEDLNFNAAAKLTDGMSGADIRKICDIAGIESLKQYCSKNLIRITDLKKKDLKEIKVKKKHFRDAIKKLQVQKEMQEQEEGPADASYA